ncbi:MAG: hypothetical protein AAF329_15755 [Cyanobacteria bacterium P01_A01_bin.17]
MPKIQLKGKHLKTFVLMSGRGSVSPAEVIALLKKLDAEISAGGKHDKARLPTTRYRTMVPRGKISPGVAKSIYDYMIRHGVTTQGVYEYDN